MDGASLGVSELITVGDMLGANESNTESDGALLLLGTAENDGVPEGIPLGAPKGATLGLEVCSIPVGLILILGAKEVEGTPDGCKLGANEGAILGIVLGASFFDGVRLVVGI